MDRSGRRRDAIWWALYGAGMAGLLPVAADPELNSVIFGPYGLPLLVGVYLMAGILSLTKVIPMTIKELAVPMLGYVFLGVIYFISRRCWGTSAWPSGERKNHGGYPYKIVETLVIVAVFTMFVAHFLFQPRWWLSVVSWLLSMLLICVTMIVFWADLRSTREFTNAQFGDIC